MAVTGVFAADFSQFDKAVAQSAAALGTLEQAGTKTESSLRLMTQSQEQLLDKIGASGGKIQDLGTAATATSGDVNTLSQSYRQFDGLLQSAGINIGPQVKGLEDLAGAAGKSATQMGLLGTAGAVVGAALTGWKIGTWIGEVTGATKAIEDLAASMMGLPNLAKETAGAQQDVINRARELTGVTHSYAESIKILNAEGKKNADANIDWRQRLADTHKELRGMSDARKEEIAIAIEAGAKTEELTNKYGLSAGALELLKTKTDESTAAAERHRLEREREAEALEKAYGKLMSDVKNANQLAIMEADAATMAAEAWNKKATAGAGYVRAMGDVAKTQKDATAAATALAAEQDTLTAANDALWQKVEQTGDAHEAAGDQAAAAGAQTVAAYQGIAQQVEITSDGVRGWLELMRATNAANSLLNQNSLFTSSSTLENQARIGGAFSPIPGFASGVSNFEGGLARVHGGEVLANLAPGTSVFPRGQGLGSTVNNTFNLVDSESNLAKRVAEMIMRQIRAGTQLGQA